VAFREVHRMEVIEVVRRWQTGESRRAIARTTGLSRITVEKYVRAARAAGVGQGGESPGESVVLQLVRLNETTPRRGSAATKGVHSVKGRTSLGGWV
jgi:transposase